MSASPFAFVAPPPPAPAPSFPSVMVLTDDQMKQQMLNLLPLRFTHMGRKVEGDVPFLTQALVWMLSTIPAAASVPADQRIKALYDWMMSLTSLYELDDATRATQTQTMPPSNLSTQQVPQVAEIPVPPDAPESSKPAKAKGDGAYLDPLDGTRYDTLRGLKSHVTRAHKQDWIAYCVTQGLDSGTGLKPGTPPPQTPAEAAVPTTPPPAAPEIPPMVGQNPVAAPPAQPQAMPQPPAQHPMAPAAALPQPTFAPAAAPVAPTPAPALVIPQPSFAPTLPSGTPPAAPQPVTIASGLSREAMAQMLGGAVDLLVLRLIDAASVSLAGRIDAGQLAQLAEKQAKEELRVSDLATSSFGVGKQTAQRRFADLLTQYPHVYLLQNGFDYVLPDGYLPILLSRVTAAHIHDKGTFHALKL